MRLGKELETEMRRSGYENKILMRAEDTKVILKLAKKETAAVRHSSWVYSQKKLCTVIDKTLGFTQFRQGELSSIYSLRVKGA